MGARPAAVVGGEFGRLAGVVVEALAGNFTVWLACRDDLDPHQADRLGVPPNRRWWIDRAGRDGRPGVPTGLDRVHVLVHCAAHVMDRCTATAPLEHWTNVFGKDLFTVVSATRRLLPALRRERGHLIIVHPVPAGSVVGRVSAAALRTFGEALRDEERASGVRVTEISPEAQTPAASRPQFFSAAIAKALDS